MAPKIIIPLSKAKTFLSLLGALLFVVLGFFFMIAPETFATTARPSTLLIQIIGFASILFFGLCLVFIAKSLFDTKPGLILDEYGITDNSSASSIGLIEWKDIEGIETIQIASTKLLIIYTNQPEKYIQRAKSGLIRTVMQTNYKSYGSPISISSTALNIKFRDLEALINKEFEKRKLV